MQKSFLLELFSENSYTTTVKLEAGEMSAYPHTGATDS